MQVDLSKFNNNWYNPGASIFKKQLWYVINICLIKNRFFPFSGIKVSVLRLFGAKIGKGVVLKPSVNIKYPWLLEIGNFSWIGEGVWIDNLAKIVIGSNVCISQGALLLCGNHNYKKETFDLIIGQIILEDGVRIGAKSIVCNGVICKTHSVLTVNSVATKDLEQYTVNTGNPAVVIRYRK
jgi:putative colanic acid biosynthesis acetyltransferase WcaF